jgi:hypothetical protein
MGRRLVVWRYGRRSVAYSVMLRVWVPIMSTAGAVLMDMMHVAPQMLMRFELRLRSICLWNGEEVLTEILRDRRL